MQGTVRIDLAKLDADIQRAAAAVDASDRQVMVAEAERVEAVEHHRDLVRLRESIAEYAASSNGREGVPTLGVPSPSALSLPLTGLNAKDAALGFIDRNPGKTMKLAAMVEGMKRLGFVGTQNAVSLNLRTFVRDGIIEKDGRRGYYRFPDRGSTG